MRTECSESSGNLGELTQPGGEKVSSAHSMSLLSQCLQQAIWPGHQWALPKKGHSQRGLVWQSKEAHKACASVSPSVRWVDTTIYLIEPMWGLSKTQCAKCPSQCPAQGGHSTNSGREAAAAVGMECSPLGASLNLCLFFCSRRREASHSQPPPSQSLGATCMGG